jgi:hypothetical protein
MRYTVVWRPVAEAALAQLWVDSPDRDAVANAADYLDEMLRLDPYAIGESRTADTRVAFQGPLGLLCEVYDDDRMVAVLNVWLCRQPPQS